MNGQALGLVETYGYIGALEAADVCLKAANVKLLGLELVSGGLVTIEIMGDVGAVKAAVDAAKAAVEKVGKLITTHVIPRPAAYTGKIMYKTPDIIKPAKAALIDEQKQEEINEEMLERKDIDTAESETTSIIEKLKGMKVVEMRAFARELEGLNMERSHIKFAKREELIKAILDYYGKDDTN